MTRDGSVHVAARARFAGMQERQKAWPGQVHVFQIRRLPESREAIEHTADFLRSCLARTNGAGPGGEIVWSIGP